MISNNMFGTSGTKTFCHLSPPAKHSVMRNASFTPTERLLSCLCVHVVLWHEARSSGRWETRSTSTSLCQSPPSSRVEALWWPRLTVTNWQWLNAPLHISNLFLRMHRFFSPEREARGGPRKITFSPPRTFYMKTHGLAWRTRQVGLQRVAQGHVAEHMAELGSLGCGKNTVTKAHL